MLPMARDPSLTSCFLDGRLPGGSPAPLQTAGSRKSVWLRPRPRGPAVLRLCLLSLQGVRVCGLVTVTLTLQPRDTPDPCCAGRTGLLLWLQLPHVRPAVRLPNRVPLGRGDPVRVRKVFSSLPLVGARSLFLIERPSGRCFTSVKRESAFNLLL